MIHAQQALERLREGNRRFVSGARRLEALTNQTRRDELLGGQAPFATIRGCSDSRVPVEIVFDQHWATCLSSALPETWSQETELRQSPDALLRHAVRANIRASANHLRAGSQLLEQVIRKDELLVVGAESSLETGAMEFFEGLPARG